MPEEAARQAHILRVGLITHQPQVATVILIQRALCLLPVVLQRGRVVVALGELEELEPVVEMVVAAGRGPAVALAAAVVALVDMQAQEVTVQLGHQQQQQQGLVVQAVAARDKPAGHHFFTVANLEGVGLVY